MKKELELIKQTVEDVFFVADIRDASRETDVVKARHAYVLLASKYSMTYPKEIMPYVNRKRATYYNSKKTAQDLISTDNDFAYMFFLSQEKIVEGINNLYNKGDNSSLVEYHYGKYLHYLNQIQVNYEVLNQEH